MENCSFYSPNIIDIAISENGNSILLCSNKFIYYSKDSGKNWQQQNINIAPLGIKSKNHNWQSMFGR